MSEASRPTIRDIAKCAGVSKTTVALALKDHAEYGIAAKTRDHIRRIAEEMGYRPDPALSVAGRRRSQGSQDFQGLILAYLRFGPVVPSAIQIEGASVRAEELGYKLEVFDVEDYANTANLSKQLMSRGIRGLMLSPVMIDVDLKLDAEQFCIVSCGTGLFSQPFDLVDSDSFMVTRQSWQRCYEAGYRRIGTILAHQGLSDRERRRRGAVACMHDEFRETIEVIPPLYCDYQDIEAIKAWLERHRPDAIVGINNGLYWKCLELGYRVPEDFAFASIAWSQADTDLAGSIEDEFTLGQRAVEYLDLKLRRNDFGIPESPTFIFVPPKWHEGSTLPAVSRG